jgi:hypothetical protein
MEIDSASMFANTMAELSGASHMMNECMRFGMTCGCRPDCPVYERGECEIQETNAAIFMEKVNEVINR